MIVRALLGSRWLLGSCYKVARICVVVRELLGGGCQGVAMKIVQMWVVVREIDNMILSSMISTYVLF